MLEDQAREGEDVVSGFSSCWQVAIGMTNEVGDLLDVRPFDPVRHLVGELTGGRLLTAFV